ncbi:flagellar hook basal-body protein [Vulgatibacter incomptus]|uniref:Flagellar basal-body rod protein FlgF n=1 Tax=Vulgatibacter incomptus TaxID=1391653 RepID=A0A0K1PIR9_9BACT|nr:flagellar hook basal-body protein [Vulgatibacter incomptus]AKU93004.1 Flagellar basal-body rod protein FlgF [Vulgatibacter incomptus]
MSDGIYVGMSAAVARSKQLESVADNLANARSVGFKASRPAFESFLPEGGDGGKVYAGAVATGVDLRPGSIEPTGRPLDLVPDDGAFFGVTLPSGAVAYTRDGRLSVDADGVLRTAGHPVLSRSGEPILVPVDDVTPVVDANGAVRVGELEVGRLALFRLEGAVERHGGSLLTPTESAAIPVSGHVRTGELELGNAGPLEAAVQLIAAQRSFDQSMQAIQTYRKLDERLGELGKVR